MPARAARVRQLRVQPAEAGARRDAAGRDVVRREFAVEDTTTPRVVRILEPQAVSVTGAGGARVGSVQEEAAEPYVLTAEECRRCKQEVSADRVTHVEAELGRVTAGVKRTDV